MASNKKIVDEVPGWIRVFEDGTVDRTWTGAPEMEPLLKPVSPHEEFINGVAVRDQIIDSKTGLAVRIYVPEMKSSVQTKAKIPLILHLHGGGYCICQPDWSLYYHFCTRLVSSVQAVLVSVYFRLAPEHRLPVAVEDSYAALLWLRANARGELSDQWLTSYADFNRVFLVGDSSGGNLVHQVAAQAGFDDIEPLKLRGGIAIQPGFISDKPSKSYLEIPENPLSTREMMKKFTSLAVPIGSTGEHPIVWPIGPQAPPLTTLKLPPMLVVVAEMDLLRDYELEYCEEMKKAGKEVEVFMNYGMSHSFQFNKLAIDMDPEIATQTNKMIEVIVSFINRSS